MLYNYLKVTFRNVWRSKVNSFINIMGLSVGIACAILIVLFVKDELTFDKFHNKIDRLYRVTTSISRDGDGDVEGMTPFVIGLTVKDEIQDIEGAIVHTSYSDMVEHGENKFRETITIVGSDFFNMFDFKTIDGSTNNALTQVSDVILTREMAEKYFGKIDITGETIRINAGGELKDYNIVAVLENVPSNSSLQFDFLVSDDNLKFLFAERQLNHYFMIAGEVYVLLREGVSPDEVEAKFPAMIEKGLGDEMYSRIHYKNGLQPMADIHLGPQMNSLAPISDSKYTMILSGIAILVLLLASINFITITLAKSINRAREIGVRKSVGAIRSQLVIQFLMESILMALISLVLGIVLVWIVLPLFNELSQKRLVFNFGLMNTTIYVAITLLIAVFAGFYPALVLSGFKPTRILKGELKVGSGRQSLRLVLVGAQFVVTIFLITSTLIMRKQLDYMQNRNLGYDKEQLIMVPLSVAGNEGMRQQLIAGMEKGERLKLMLEQEPDIASVTITSHDFGPGSWTNLGYTDENEEEFNFFFNTVDPNYLNTLGIKLLSGRDFELNNEADRRRSILVNKAFVKSFNLEDPIGKRIPHEEFEDHEIIGVIEDFNFASLHLPVEPLVLSINPIIGFSGASNVNINSDPTPKLAIRVNAGSIDNVLSLIESRFAEAYPGDPFDYNFVDQQLDTQYSAEQNLGKIVSSATVLTILIGAMGLFALSMLTMNARLKEMSIRKVLGATSVNVSLVLSKNYIILVLIALFISIPLSYQVMSTWLNEFAFRTNIGVWSFIIVGFISVLVAWIAISYHSLKLAFSNPVDGLRTE